MTYSSILGDGKGSCELAMLALSYGETSNHSLAQALKPQPCSCHSLSKSTQLLDNQPLNCWFTPCTFYTYNQSVSQPHPFHRLHLSHLHRKLTALHQHQ
jgi:hypothetical protein